ncbi:MAG: LamG domain-containing protein [Kiritimatiellaeota bacterium]|nr:LamG domain-containing protein [Kiritimatiellota bacterium]
MEKILMTAMLMGLVFSTVTQLSAAEDGNLVLFYSFDKKAKEIIDKSARNNNGKIVKEALWGDSFIELKDGSYIEIDAPSGFDFGEGGFAVEAVVSIPEEEQKKEIGMIACGYDDIADWQLYRLADGSIWFNSRSTEGDFIGVHSAPLPKNKFIHLVGARDEHGNIDLYINGQSQGKNSAANANYKKADKIKIGMHVNNPDWCFSGKLKEVRVYRRAISGRNDEIIKRGLEFLKESEKEFWKDSPSAKINMEAQEARTKKDNALVKPVDSGERFEIAAWVDSFDMATIFDTEKSSGTEKILDHAAELGTTIVFWRNCSGSTMRYQSKVESHAQETILDKRRTFENRAIYGWLRYGDAQPDLIRTALQMCKEKGMKPYIHWPFEETHGGEAISMIGEFNMEHPQFWGRIYDGQPWCGRLSLAYEPVIKHKLDLLDELLERGAEGVFIDFFRDGGWSPRFEYVDPVINSYKKKYGAAPPANYKDLRWAEHVSGYVTEYLRRIRRHLDDYQKTTGRKIEVIIGIPGDILTERPLVRYGADWQTWVKENLIDAMFLYSLAWDKANPMESTRESGRALMESIKSIDGKCRVFWPVSSYPYGGNGLDDYMGVMNKKQSEVAAELMQQAWEEGANGITLQCVDYDNYNKETRAAIKILGQTTCRFVIKGGAK